VVQVYSCRVPTALLFSLFSQTISFLLHCTPVIKPNESIKMKLDVDWVSLQAFFLLNRHHFKDFFFQNDVILAV
jgi:hypothetical protein